MSKPSASLGLPADYAAKIADRLNWKLAQVAETLEIEEQKDGYFYAKLKPKKFLDKPDFQALCRLTRDLGGEDYLAGAKAWRVPGAYVKKGPTSSQEKPSGHAIGPGPEPIKGEITSAIRSALGQPSHIIQGYTMIPISALSSMPFQSRIDIEGPDFADLVESIRTVGILHPILVREKASGLFEIVAGERRRAAAKKAGLVEVPAIVKVLTDQEAYEIQLVENVQRKNLSGLETGQMLDMMIKKFGYTQEALGKKVSKSQGWVSQHLAMLQTPEIASKRGEIITRVIKSPQIGEITEHQAREILAAPEEKQEEIIEKINETGEVPSVREIHEIAHPEKKQIMCARCGFPIEGTPVHLGEGKYYDAECAEQEVAETKEGLISEQHAGPFEEEHAVEPEVPSRAKAVAVQIGTFECTECKQHFIIEHLPNGKHKLKQIRSV
jgi:ParB family chromosome partitioning protein